jgi:hypothetical protein
MKNLICSVLILFAFSACKKEHTPAKSTDPEITNSQIAAVSDSASYTIDGRIYTAAAISTSTPEGNQSVNQKAVFNNNGTMVNWDIIGDKDSILFYRENTVSGTKDRASITISFAKKFNKKQLTMDAFMYHPTSADILGLFTKGKHPYAEDYTRENTENGVAISVSVVAKEYPTYSSYIPKPIQMPTKLKAGFQNNSTFEILSFVKNKNGGYNLEAKFSAYVFNDKEEQKKLENGYIRLHIE